MKRLCLVLFMALPGLLACGSSYDDSGAPDPASWWSWICPDGAPAPDSGCRPPPSCPDGEAGDAGARGDC
jgi:hypothetical protein